MYLRRILASIAVLPILLSGSAVIVFRPSPAGAEVKVAIPHKAPSRAIKLRTSAPSDPDTVWIGHVQTPTGLPGTAGGYGPYKIGRGPHLTGTGAGAGPNGTWTFDHFQAGETDSLQGWWPIALPYSTVGGSNLPDYLRPFYGFDYGNQGNYAIPQGSPKRTFGVTGYWHRDGGVGQPAIAGGSDHNPVGPTWTALGGSFSAWCGLRSHGDVAAQDLTGNGGTGNYFNQSLLEYNGNNTNIQIGSQSPDGTDKNFPGYGSQWDQLLYRDIALADGAGLDVSFLYRTDMSTGLINASNIRIGWFDKDPLSLAAVGGSATDDDNFISSSAAGVDAPIDSFMVYIGVPVEPVSGAANDFTASDGITYEIYDRKRRWFSEVIRIDQPYGELMSTFGVNATQTFSVNLAGGAGSIVQDILDAQAGAGGTVRLLFRIKTNRSNDDEDNVASGFSSGSAGAAIVDNVVVNGWAAANGNFEASNAINNDTAVAATATWKSTGKPPGVFFHTHNLAAGLPYDDPCGVVGSSSRVCNMTGRVVTAGNHDAGEKPGGLFGANDQDRQHWLVSPTINLKSTGSGDYNGMGIDAEIADAQGDIYLDFDLYTGVFQFGVGPTANGIRIGWQSFPAEQPNGVKCWGEVAKTLSFSSYDGTRGCYAIQDIGIVNFSPAGAQALTNGLILTTNPSGVPDSIRAYVEHLTLCYRRPVTGLQCSPSSGPLAGGYLDNLSIAFIDAPPPPQIAVNVWDLFNDTFPVNGNAGFIGTPSFDTLAAQVRTGYNSGAQTGNLNRHNIPGDTAWVVSTGNDIRMDLVFRILPGVGNYATIGNRNSGLRKRPDGGGGGGNLVASGDASFWGKYLADNGAVGTGGSGTAGPGHAGGVWSQHLWNSARMDTVEGNLFPTVGGPGNPQLAIQPGLYKTHYHESDPKYATLGIEKNRCFLSDVSIGASGAADNIDCGNGTTPPNGNPYPPPWTANASSGFDANEISGQPGKTLEFTKILPDGQLTPGAHVQYFFRRSTASAPLTNVELMPDTFTIFPQVAEGPSFDGHRWQQFGVLPDRWKDPAFGVGGTGMACMLVVDIGDRQGDELTWVSLADSIGMTAPNKYGAHNGWHARGNQDITLGVNPASVPAGDPTMAVRPNIGQPGTVWDLFGHKGGESNVPAGRIGSRAASQVNPGLATGKFSTHGPTGEMLRGYYRTLVLLHGTLGANTLGPIPDQSDNDIGILTDFLTNPSGGTTPRGLIALGLDMVEGQDADHPTFFPNFFGASLRSPDYRTFAPNPSVVVDLTPVSPVNTSGSIYGLFNSCLTRNDVLNVEVTIPGAQAAAFYENVSGGNNPFIAAVYAPDGGGGRVARTLVGGWTLGFSGSRHTLTTGGIRHLWLNALTGIFGGLCTPTATPIGVGDEPGAGPGTAYVSFMNLRSGNPMRSGEARIGFGIAKTERVEIKVYDVTGRLVKTVANRVFQGGAEHVVTWDGTDDAGRPAARGVYFYQLRSPSFTSERKLTVLKN